jgi:4'-phosphopantetheinyl transferase EntD
MFVSLLEGMDIAGKTVTADALLAQRNLARYLVEERDVHCSPLKATSRPCWPTSACSLKDAARRTFANRSAS